MNGVSTCLNPPGAANDKASASTRYLARQPILNLRGRTFAYELLFRNGTDSAFMGGGEFASRVMFDNMVVYGLRRLTAGLPAFINCTAENLLSNDVSVLNPSMTVLEILEDVQPTRQIIKACRRLKAEGYRLALDDFEYTPSLDPLVEIADILKVDFLRSSASARSAMMAKLKRFRGTFLAEKVETQEEYERARSEGFTLFQGYYFCRPDPLKETKVPANRHVHLRLLQLLQQQPLNLHEISDVVKSEPSLTYRLLRFVNSPVCGLRQEIRSIPAALLEVGDDFFRRIATLAIACELNASLPEEVVRLALTRARFCELAAVGCSFDSAELYLLGLFSLLDAMLQKPMAEAISPLQLRETMRDALLGVDNSLRCPLRWLESYEAGDFAACDALAASHGTQQAFLAEMFAQAAEWSDQLFSAGR